jgi:predicted MPP superfamily phosphohydrolase
MSAVKLATPARITRRHFLIGAGATAAGLAIYSGEIARHDLDITHQTISLSRLPPAFHGYRIIQLSDIHLDEFTEPAFLEYIVHRLNALTPDIVLLTGDFITRGSLTFIAANHAAYRCAEILSTIKAPLIYAVLGNHDHAVRASLVINALKGVHIPVLINRNIPIDRNGDRIWLSGVDDPSAGIPNLDRALPEDPGDNLVILMSHGPDYADNVIAHPRGKFVDLMLSGHSHGGQIRLPVVGPLVLPPWGKKYVEGYFRFNQMQLYVNRGIGTVGLPFRLNCPPEMTVITLQPA